MPGRRFHVGRGATRFCGGSRPTASGRRHPAGAFAGHGRAAGEPRGPLRGGGGLRGFALRPLRRGPYRTFPRRPGTSPPQRRHAGCGVRRRRASRREARIRRDPVDGRGVGPVAGRSGRVVRSPSSNWLAFRTVRRHEPSTPLTWWTGFCRWVIMTGRRLSPWIWRWKRWSSSTKAPLKRFPRRGSAGSGPQKANSLRDLVVPPGPAWTDGALRSPETGLPLRSDTPYSVSDGQTVGP